MAQAGYTPIQLYYSTTASAAPSSGNLANGELAINITDGKLYYKDNGGTVRVLAGTGGTGVVAGSNTQVQFNNNGVFGASSGLTWDGTNLTASQLRSSGLTSGRVTYASTSGLLVDSANMTFNGTRLTVADLADSGLTSGRVVYSTAGGALVDSANLLYSGTDLTVYGITVGRGAGAVSTNTAVGASALAANTTGFQNTAGGANALAANTTGAASTAFGYNALALSTGDANNAFGRLAMPATTTGTNNAAFGNNTLQANTTGSYNVALGANALNANTTASGNTAVGYQAGYNNTTGPLNVFVGRQAGYSNTVGQGSVLIGYQAGYLLNDTASSSTDNTFVGSYAGYSVTTGSKNTFIGGSIQNGGAGYLMTTGSKNTILGGFTGNQNGVNITTLSNYVVLSDGDGYPAFWGQGGASGYMKLEAGRLEFPATQNASSNANTLDDYEEGTWTPALLGAGSPTYTENYGRYVKIGRLVTLVGKLAVTGVTSSANTITVTGLPFSVQDASDAGQRACSFISGDVQNMGSYVASAALRTAGSSLEGVRDNGSGSTVYWAYNELSSTSFEFSINVTYLATA